MKQRGREGRGEERNGGGSVRRESRDLSEMTRIRNAKGTFGLFGGGQRRRESVDEVVRG